MGLWHEPITNATDWSALAFVGQFWQAMDQRCAIAQMPRPPRLPAAGDYVGAGGYVDVFNDFNWPLRPLPYGYAPRWPVAYLQRWITTNYRRFLKPGVGWSNFPDYQNVFGGFEEGAPE